MQPTEGNRKRNAASGRQSDSFGFVNTGDQDLEIDLKLVEALARIERVRSKALNALGTLISAN